MDEGAPRSPEPAGCLPFRSPPPRPFSGPNLPVLTSCVGYDGLHHHLLHFLTLATVRHGGSRRKATLTHTLPQKSTSGIKHRKRKWMVLARPGRVLGSASLALVLYSLWGGQIEATALGNGVGPTAPPGGRLRRRRRVCVSIFQVASKSQIIPLLTSLSS